MPVSQSTMIGILGAGSLTPEIVGQRRRWRQTYFMPGGGGHSPAAGPQPGGSPPRTAIIDSHSSGGLENDGRRADNPPSRDRVREPLGLPGDGEGRRAAPRARSPMRATRHLRPPCPGFAVPIRRRRRRARDPSLHRGRRRRGAPARRRGGKDDSARHRRPDRHAGDGRPRLAPVHRPDAQRGTGRHRLYRGRPKRGAAGRGDPGSRRSGAASAARRFPRGANQGDRGRRIERRPRMTDSTPTTESLRFCSRCGGRLVFGPVEGEDRNRLACERCGVVCYVNPRLVATTLPITDRGEVVLIKRGIAPGYGRWAQPGGFLEIDETVEEAAARETLEETGLEVELGEILGLYSRVAAAVVVVAFEARIVGGTPTI